MQIISSQGKLLKLFLFFLLGTSCATAQTSRQLGQSGDSAYNSKNYPLAIQYYFKQADKERMPSAKGSIYYNIACCYALSGDNANAWKSLDISVKEGYNNFDHLLKDSDLDPLHADKKWKKFSKLNKEQKKRLSDPKKAEFVTSDIHNFWDAYDKVQNDTAHMIDIYRENYFDKASLGLQDYYVARIFSVESFAANQKRKQAFYRAIRENTLKVDQFKRQMRESFIKFKEIYDAGVFPNVYFVIGRWSSAGTVSNNGLLIGTDMLSKSDAVPLNELSLWEKNNYKPIDDLPFIVAHELIHSQQGSLKNDTTTLSACIREGMADFLGELISGKSSNPRLLVFGLGKEKDIWKDFEKEMNLNRSFNWIANSSQERPDHPADLGYWMGYQICKAYYEEMTDKKQAVYDILHIQDYKAFLAKSRYKEKIGL